MAGIYIHVPFCKKACHYCNFHFSTSRGNQQLVVDAMLKEISVNAQYLENDPIETIYFGGGTPSLLSHDQLSSIFALLNQTFDLSSVKEVTLEANPDDLTIENINFWKHETPINRFSIGVQSFDDEQLQWMNRSHTSKQAIDGITKVKEAGFDNLSLDIIFGLPGLSVNGLQHTLELALSFEPTHISSYCLTVEPKTALAKLIEKGKTVAPADEMANIQYAHLTAVLAAHGIGFYEISNFARVGFEAIHNSNYWAQQKYLGIGPGAHSFNGFNRSWNISNNPKYVAGIQDDLTIKETEILSLVDLYNEYVMTSLRTKWGCDLNLIRNRFGDDSAKYFETQIAHYQAKKLVLKNDSIYTVTPEGRMFADGIASAVFQLKGQS